MTRAALLVPHLLLAALIGVRKLAEVAVLRPGPSGAMPSAGGGMTVPPAPAAYSVSIGPVSVPEIVDQPQFVVSLAANQVEFAEQGALGGAAEPGHSPCHRDQPRPFPARRRSLGAFAGR